MGSIFRSTIKDDRGQELPAINLRELKKSADDPTSTRRDLAKYLKDVIHAESQRGSLMGWVVPLVMILVGAAIIATLAYFGGGNIRTPLLPFIFIAVAVSRVFTKRRIGNQLASTIVAEGICGSCAYSLRSMAVEADGCVVCAECGAAWKHLRITTPHWNRPPLPPATKAVWWRRFFASVPKDRDLLTPDDRGRYVRALDSRLVLLPAERKVEVGNDKLLDMRRQIRSIGAVPRMLTAILVPLTLGAAPVIVTGGSEAGWVVGTSIVLVLGVLFGLPVYFGRNWLPPAKSVRALVAAGWCGSCGRDITSLPPEVDGCVVCRGCAASWRTVPTMEPPIGSPRVPPPEQSSP